MVRLPRPLLRRPIGIATAIGLGTLGALTLLGEYGHRQLTRSTRSEFRDEPGNWGLGAAEELVLRSRDGLALHAWLFHAPGPAPTVIACHGHNANKHTMLPVAQFLQPEFNVVLLDSRGHGESAGSRTTIGYEERLDVHAVVDELERRELGPVGVLGTSMGAAIAILAAAEDERIRAVVADSPFARLRWAVSQVARVRGYPRLVAPAIAHVGCRMTSLRLRYPMAAFDPIEVVDRIAPRPLLLIHGERDGLIPVTNSRLIYARAGQPKELWVLGGLDHCRGLAEACDTYPGRILEFFRRELRLPAAAGDVGAPSA